jgi:thiamine-monophosphate kinase
MPNGRHGSVAPPKPEMAGGSRPAGEDAVLERVASSMRVASGPVRPGEIWIGDDAAVVVPPAGMLVLATDAAVAGVHADLSLVGLDDLGWKALTAAVSDVGAMGARPLHALVTMCAPPGTDLDLLASGVAAASAAWSCPVVGGDLSTATEVVVSVAVTGILEGPAPPVTRSGARPGDRLAVTGPLGGSAAGLRVLRAAAGAGGTGGGTPGTGAAAGAGGTGDPDGGNPDAWAEAAAPAAGLAEAHRRPLARLAEGRAARDAGATAMIDVSDGLALDLHRMADASGVGFRLDAVPVAPGATREEALGGGEDYELVVATPDPVAMAGAFAAAGLRAPVVIGACTADPAERCLGDEPLARLGWEHPLG